MFVSVIYPCSKIFSNCNVFGLLIFKTKIYELFRCMLYTAFRNQKWLLRRLLTLWRLGWSIWHPVVVFLKIYILPRGWIALGFFTFNIIISHILPENFIEIPQVVQKYEDFLHPCYLFSSIFWIFWHFLVTKKLMTSAYNGWFQNFFLLSTYSKQVV